MNDYSVTATSSEPEVEMRVKDGLVRFTGECYPENASAFFGPIFSWLENFLAEQNKTLRVEFRLSYFNSSSSKFLLDMIEQLNRHAQAGNHIEVAWHYEPDDEDLMESGEELAADALFPFHLIKTAAEE